MKADEANSGNQGRGFPTRRYRLIVFSKVKEISLVLDKDFFGPSVWPPGPKMCYGKNHR